MGNLSAEQVAPAGVGSAPESTRSAPGGTDSPDVRNREAISGLGLGYKVKVENYFGPLDLLLHLVRESEVDITRITLAQVAEQYIAYIVAMKKLDLELAGEFMAIASQLLLIKSRTIAPPPLESEETEEAEEEGDASLELIKKLLDYKRFKDRGKALDRLFDERSRRVGRPRMRIDGETEQEPLRDMELWDLVLLFSRVMKSVRIDGSLSILYRDVPLEVFLTHILETVAARQNCSFAELLGAEKDRGRTLGMLLAILQLARDGKVSIHQEADLGEIRVAQRTEEAPPAPTS